MTNEQMTNEQMIKIIQKAVNKYGEKQLDIAQEELAELIQAISKYKRAITHDEREKALKSVLEEMADTWIMFNQIAMLLGFTNDAILINMKYKLRRLDKRMENE